MKLPEDDSRCLESGKAWVDDRDVVGWYLDDDKPALECLDRHELRCCEVAGKGGQKRLSSLQRQVLELTSSNAFKTQTDSTSIKLGWEVRRKMTGLTEAVE